ncbi:MFS transporter [Terasakiella sp. A23]|uniref:MFS transporter n=1 Tax=Terasakiella sp. FCG-A23 TaxID=3080561 RepID=UPI0029530A29|nr:MFS transporter [Terasakiella sp. A23]MDV7340354.1 MFS transporter [Terasakiella sp. A23]
MIRSGHARSFMKRLFIASLLLLTLFLSGFSYFALSEFEKSFAPEVQKKATLIGQKISTDLSQALGYGIPLSDLRGMDTYLNRFVTDNQDIEAIEILTADGGLLYQSDQLKSDNMPTVNLPIKHNAQTLAQIHIHAAPDYLNNLLLDMSYDQITTLLICLLVAFELLSFFVYGRIIGPLALFEKLIENAKVGDFQRTIHCRTTKELARIESLLNTVLYQISEKKRDIFDTAYEIRSSQISQKVIKRIDHLLDTNKQRLKTGEPYAFKDMGDENIRLIRFPLFLFMFAEELSRPFLPMLAQQYQQVAWLADQQKIASALPIAIFMAVIVIVSLISGHWVERWGGKKLFLFGIIPALAGYIGVYFAQDYIQFLSARALSAFGYAIVFVAAQGYVANSSTPENRAANMAVFVGGVLVAGICGPAIGGILAAQIGYQLTFVISAVFVIAAMIMLIGFLGEDSMEKYQSQTSKRNDVSFAIFQTGDFTTLSFFCAVPAKIILTGIIYLLTPLYLIEQDASEATIGRVIMIYGVLVIFIMPKLSSYADKKNMHAQMVILGGLIAGCGGLIFFFVNGLWAMVATVCLIGIGQALSMPTQLAEVQHIFAKDTSKFSIASGLGIFRSVERIGSVAGPLLAGSLAIKFGIETAIALIGLIGFVGVSFYGLLSLMKKGRG